MNPKTLAPEFTEKQIRIGLRTNILAAGIGVVWFVIVQGLPLIMLLEALGATGVMIGMISMLNQAAMLIQIPASLLADRLIHRKRFWFITVLLARLIWLLPAAMILLSKGSHHTIIIGTLATVGVSALLIQSSSSSWWSWMADLIPDHLRSRFWNIRQGVCTTVMLSILGLAGWFLDLFPKGNFTGFGIILLLGTICGALESIIHLRVPEPASTPAPTGISLIERIIRPLRDSNFRYFTLIMCVWFFGAGLIGPFTMVYLKQNFHALYSQLSIIQMAGLLGAIATSFFTGRLIQRAGIRTFGMVMLLLAPLFHLVWFFLDFSSITLVFPFLGACTFPRFVFLIVCNSLLAGSVYTAVGMYQLNMLTSIVPRDGRTIAMAMHWFLIGTVSATAPLIAGWIKDLLEMHPMQLALYHGTAFTYLHLLLILHASLIWFVALPLAKKLKSVETDMTVVKALSHIFIANPLRMARDIYGFNGAIISSIDKTKDIVMQSAEMAFDAMIESAETAKDIVVQSAEKALDVVAQSAERVKQSADKAKGAMQGLRRTGKRSDDKDDVK
jgi:MFS family permease